MWRCATIYVDRLLVHVCSYKVPRRPFESARLDAELKVRAFLGPFGHTMEVRYSWKFDRQLAGEYGLRNKREIWRISLILSKIRRAARELLKLDAKDPKRLFEGAGGTLFSLSSHNPFHSLFVFNVPFVGIWIVLCVYSSLTCSSQVMPSSVVSFESACWTSRGCVSITCSPLRSKISWNVAFKPRSSRPAFPSRSTTPVS